MAGFSPKALRANIFFEINILVHFLLKGSKFRAQKSNILVNIGQITPYFVIYPY